MKRRTAKIRTTKIKLGRWSRRETWDVPRGFGAMYRRVLVDHWKLVAAGKPGKITSCVIDLLALIGYTATLEQVIDWDLRKRVEAVIYASTEHLSASDNPIQRHPRPTWLPERPWQGPWSGKGAFAGPTGTPIETP